MLVLSVDRIQTDQLNPFVQLLLLLTKRPYAPELRAVVESNSSCWRFLLFLLVGGADVKGSPESWLLRTESQSFS